MAKVGDKVRVLIDAFTDESHIGEIYEVIEIDGDLINVDAEWNDGTTMNYDRGEYEIVTEPQPDIHALIANLGRRLHEVETHNAQQSYEINELYRTVASLEAQL